MCRPLYAKHQALTHSGAGVTRGVRLECTGGGFRNGRVSRVKPCRFKTRLHITKYEPRGLLARPRSLQRSRVLFGGDGSSSSGFSRFSFGTLDGEPTTSDVPCRGAGEWRSRPSSLWPQYQSLGFHVHVGTGHSCGRLLMGLLQQRATSSGPAVTETHFLTAPEAAV